MKKARTLSKINKEMHSLYYIYKRKKTKVPEDKQKDLEALFLATEEALRNKDLLSAQENIQALQTTASIYLKKNHLLHYLQSFLGTIFFILIILLIRQMWFENCNIPSGSMRPTMKENDFLIVSKTAFGIDTPTRKGHFYFDNTLLQRGDIIIFTASGLDIPDPDTKYLYFIPGKKQLVKRLVGKPGDTLYFYGGKIYGIDASGNEITAFAQEPWFKNIPHIPFMRFSGKSIHLEESLPNIVSSIMIYQMNLPFAKISILPSGKVEGSLLIKEDTFTPSTHDFGEFWGINNFGMSRILTKSMMQGYQAEPLAQADYYLEIIHHPSIHPPKTATTFSSSKYFSFIQPELRTSHSYIPLDQKHLEKILHSLTTSRFCVNKGFASLKHSKRHNLPYLKNVPDGCYEFFNGIAYQVYFGGITKKLPQTHPLYSSDPEQITLLYNLGIEFNTLFAPNEHEPSLLPSRYAYFYEGDLFLMESKIFLKNDPVLIDFIQKEHEKAASTLLHVPYLPFDDPGPPLTKSGKLDKAFIEQYGLTIPKNRYLVLGDNYANSADSREFGFVPRKNLRGKTSFIIWPFGSRWGAIFQPDTPWLSLPHVVIWGIGLLSIICVYLYNRKKRTAKLHF